MQISRVDYSFKNITASNIQNLRQPYYIKNNAISADTVNFTQKRVVENHIVEDLNSYEYDNYDQYEYSKKLKQTVNNTQVNKIYGKDSTLFTIKNPDLGIIQIKTNKNHNNVKPGFIIGKSGLFATLELASLEKKYVVILPADSELHTEDGLVAKVIGAKKNPSFTGSTCTVNAFYLPDKTLKSLNDFIEMTENSTLFKNIEKSSNDYSEHFHPYILAGGFGTRLKAISDHRNDNKPSTSTPIPNWNLINFNLLNLYQANLLDKKTDIDFVVQNEANSAVGCVITTLGYKIGYTENGLDLINNGKSIVPPNKHLIIMPSDNITDVKLSKALDKYLETKNAGMMIVGVPDYRCYGGLILHNENNEIENFITKPSAELLNTGLGRIKYTDENGKEKVLTDCEGQPTSLGNAFIYIINPEIFDDIADIYRNKINNAYKELMNTKKEHATMNKEEFLKVIECLWDREIIPSLVEKARSGQLKDKEGNDLKIFSYDALDADWSDVGEYSSYYKTLKNITRDDAYVNLPAPIKQSARENIIDNVIFNIDVKDDFKKFIGNGSVKGDVIIVEKAEKNT